MNPARLPTLEAICFVSQHLRKNNITKRERVKTGFVSPRCTDQNYLLGHELVIVWLEVVTVHPLVELVVYGNGDIGHAMVA